MATFQDVATNFNMLDIANAIRAITRDQSSMTIPQMPERLLNIRLVEVSAVEVNCSLPAPASLGIYDTAIRHLFLAMPASSLDSEILASLRPEVSLSYDSVTGELSMLYAQTKSSVVSLLVVDILLSSDSSSVGVLLGGAGSGLVLPYNADKSYEVGDLFIYAGTIGLTDVAHSAEAFNSQHNVLMSTKGDYQELASRILELELAELKGTAVLTLSADGWQNNRQSVAFSLDTDKRNVIDVYSSSVKEWAHCGVLGIQETATGILFECEIVPENDLTFRVVSFSVKYNEGELTPEQIAAIQAMSFTMVDGELIVQYDSTLLDLDFDIEGNVLVVTNNVPALEFEMAGNELEAKY